MKLLVWAWDVGLLSSSVYLNVQRFLHLTFNLPSVTPFRPIPTTIAIASVATIATTAGFIQIRTEKSQLVRTEPN